MNAWLANPLGLFFVAMASYWVGLVIYERAGRTPLLHPLIIACIPASAWLLTFDIPVSEFREANRILHFLLGPATVALALPLYLHWAQVRQQWLPITLTLLLGLTASIGVTLGLASLMGADDLLLKTLAPKSVTTPIALEIIKLTGGWPDLTAGIVIVTGVIGAVIGPPLFSLFRVESPAARGFAMGLVAHGVGTARALELSPVMGAYSSLAMGLSGILSAAVLPWLVPALL